MSVVVEALPRLALSVRQPYAWAIIHAGKDTENRDWRNNARDRNHRGRVAIHAAQGLAKFEYESARDFMAALGIACPPVLDLQRGGIIGSVEIIDAVRESESRWFFGPYGLVLRNPIACEFIPCAGQLGFFPWSRNDAVKAPIAPWMAGRGSNAKGARKAMNPIARANADLFNAP